MKISDILRWVIMGTLISLIFINLSCSDDSDTMDEDCGCIETTRVSAVITGANGLPKFINSSTSEPVPCQEESYVRTTNGNGGSKSITVECN